MLYVKPIDGYCSVEVTCDFKDTLGKFDWRVFPSASWSSFNSSKGFWFSILSESPGSGEELSAGPPANELIPGLTLGPLIGYLLKPSC